MFRSRFSLFITVLLTVFVVNSCVVFAANRHSQEAQPLIAKKRNPSRLFGSNRKSPAQLRREKESKLEKVVYQETYKPIVTEGKDNLKTAVKASTATEEGALTGGHDPPMPPNQVFNVTRTTKDQLLAYGGADSSTPHHKEVTAFIAALEADAHWNWGDNSEAGQAYRAAVIRKELRNFKYVVEKKKKWKVYLYPHLRDRQYRFDSEDRELARYVGNLPKAIRFLKHRQKVMSALRFLDIVGLVHGYLATAGAAVCIVFPRSIGNGILGHEQKEGCDTWFRPHDRTVVDENPDAQTGDDQPQNVNSTGKELAESIQQR